MFGDIKVDEITDVDVFKSTYFAEGFDTQNAGYTVSEQVLFRSWWMDLLHCWWSDLFW